VLAGREQWWKATTKWELVVEARTLIFAGTLVAVYSAAGCRTTAGSAVVDASGASEGNDAPATPANEPIQAVTVASASEIVANACTGSTPFSFKLVPTDPQVTEADVELPNGFFSDSRVAGEQPTDDDNIRLDVCVDDSVDPPKATLNRVVTRGLMKDGTGKFGIVTFPDAQPSEELGKLLFGQAGEFAVHKVVQLTPQVGRNVIVALQLRSWSAKGQVGLVAVRVAENVNPADGTPQNPPAGLQALIGKLAFGNPITDAPPGQQLECGDQEARVETFKIETATFTMRICRNFIGTAGTTNYKILKLEVSDTSEALPASARGKTFGTACNEFDRDSSPAELARDTACVWRLAHHNVCDSLVLRLPHATYSATNAPFGETLLGCESGDVVPGAPTRSVDDQSNSFYFQVKVGAAAPKVFHEPCGKVYMQSCQATEPPQ
jgi:hypothetical protein